MDIISLFWEPVADYLLEPIGRQFGYLFCYKSNIVNLERENEKLKNIKDGVEQNVSVAQRDSQNISLHIKDWMKKAETINFKVVSILEHRERVEEGCLNGCCTKVKSCYMLGRRSKKMIEELVKLQNDAKDHVSSTHPVPSIGFEPIAIESMADFESRKSIEENLISTLKDNNVNVIGLCGMGGVGKTSMAKKIGKMMKEENVFHEIVMAFVGHKPELYKIQDEIADELGLTLEEGSLMVRAGRLYTRLMDEKKFLIILDDVWRHLDLRELGIPAPDIHKGCKILITTRYRNVCFRMGAQKMFTITVLTEDEAWHLFMQMVGNTIKDPELLRIARNVAMECNGLPVALVTIGQSLSNKSKRSWMDAHTQLKRAEPKHISGILDNVYRPLVLSYSCLESDEAKDLFLMCSLFPKSAHIPVDTLLRYGMGLHMFSGVENLEEARNRVYSLVETLKECFLLIDNDHEETSIQMHGVVHDVAVFIGSEDKKVFLIDHNINSNKWPRKKSYEFVSHISLISRAFDELPENLDCPNLQVLLLECNYQQLKATDNFFTGMRRLRVLEMRDFCIPSLPSSLRLCTSLRTLQLHSCEFVKEISDGEEDRSGEVLSFIAELQSLEILSFSYSSIKVLPFAIGNLCHLRLLDLTGCTSLNVIQPGIISRLLSLEEIYLKQSFGNWGTKNDGKERTNASLIELESLQNLTALEIMIPKTHLMPKNFQLPSTPTKYDLSIGLPSEMGKEFQNEIGQGNEKVVCLYLPLPHSFEGPFLHMLKNAECLYSRGDGSISAIEALAPDGFQNLKQLRLDDCYSLKHLVSTKDMVQTNCQAIFPLLEKIYLDGISCLKEISHDQLPHGSFAKLRHLDFKQLPMLIHIWKCPTHGISLKNLIFISLNKCHRLQNLFSLAIAQSLQQLEQLKVTKCNRMEEIISDEGITIENRSSLSEIKFPRLRYLGLDKLRNFSRFYKWIDHIQFPRLGHLQLNNLPLLKNFFHEKDDGFTSTTQDETNESQSLFNEKNSILCLKMMDLSELANVSNLWSCNLATGFFNTLENLKVVSCHGLKNLFFPAMAKGLVNLKELEIKNCSAMKVIIEKDGEEDEREEKSILSLFPQLEMLRLLALDDLVRFCHLKHDLEMVSLEDLEIKNCPKFSTFNPGSISTPNLKALKVDDQQLQTNDIKSSIQQHFQAKDQVIYQLS